MQTKKLEKRFEQNKGKIICAEGFLFEMERRGYLQAGAFVPEVVLENPGALEELHNEFAMTGSDVILAFTYYAHRSKLRAIGKEKLLEPMNLKALKIAKKVARKNGLLMAGNICNTWSYDPNNQSKTGKDVRKIFTEQVEWAKKEKADFIIGETFHYLGEALIALEVIKDFGFEAVINLTPTHKKTLDGYEWDEACRILHEKGADVVGLNCGRGPKTMLSILKKIRKKVKGKIAALPVPYSTTQRRYTFQQLKTKDGKQAFPVNLDSFLLNRDEVAYYTKEFKKIGVDFFGLCCGNSPHLTRAMAETLGRDTISSNKSADMSRHPVFGKGKYVSKHDKKHLHKEWK